MTDSWTVAAHDDIRGLFESIATISAQFLKEVHGRPVVSPPQAPDTGPMPENGLGVTTAVRRFLDIYGEGISGSNGPRYWGYVTGGATPAAIAGDWLASAFDQNATTYGDSWGPYLELDTLRLLRELLGIPETFSGSFVSGSTMANFAGLAVARQWYGRQQGIDCAEEGIADLRHFEVASGTAHSSIGKALSMLGHGRGALTPVPTIGHRESVDIRALSEYLERRGRLPSVIVANAGTVNTASFDDLRKIGELRAKYNFWLHVDGAFGLVAGASRRYRGLLGGLEMADSLAVDAHKWLNVPYDSAVQWVRREHLPLQFQVFKNFGPYLGEMSLNEPNFIHLTPENSRRMRALPLWIALNAYGRKGFGSIVDTCCRLASSFANAITETEGVRLLAPAGLNVVCFALEQQDEAGVKRDALLTELARDGRVFMTPTTYEGIPAIRAAFSNWQTRDADVDIGIAALVRALERIATTA